MAQKLNPMRLLDANRIVYEVKTYDPNIHDASAVAAAIGVPATEVYKTLVVERSNARPILVMIPANRQLDLKKLAAGLGEKKLSMAAQADAETQTGLKVGGIGALALTHKHWDVYLDQTAAVHEQICVSAEQRGVNLRIPVKDLIQMLAVKMADASTDT